MSTPAPREARVAVVAHESSVTHLSPVGHPESIARLTAVHSALEDAALGGLLDRVTARRATDVELRGAHDQAHITRVRDHVEGGGTRLDADTFTSPGSLDAALHAAGAGLTAVEYLVQNPHLNGAFVVARPPGHHATQNAPMGFCIFNNIAVTAAHLADRGERVLIVDWDVHHGNGTQAIFWNDPRVEFVSLHEANNYPFSGRIHERGGNDAPGSTLNLAMPSGATGDVYRHAMDSLVAPIANRTEPTWILISAGFDAHHGDPLSDMCLTAGDYGTFTRQLCSLVPRSRIVMFLEGGYGLDGLRQSVRSSVAGLAGVDVEEEAPSAGGPGMDIVAEARASIA